MPEPVSDSYHPEFGTRERANQIIKTLSAVYAKLSMILKLRNPVYILTLVDSDLPDRLAGVLTEKEWRLLRFAIERAKDSI